VKRLIFCAALMAATAPSALAQSFINWPQDFQWQLDTGLDYSSGKYGAATNTTVLSVPLEGRVQLDRVRLEFSMPYVQEKGPGVLAGGVVVGSSTTVTTRSGLGDLNLGAAFVLNHDGEDMPAIEVEGLVKVPTAGAGIGTGKTDYGVQVNLYHSFTPRFMLFGSIGYQWLTSFSTYQLESGVAATAGANYRASDTTSIGISAAYRQEYFAGLGAETTVSPYVLWDISKHFRISGYGTLGIGKASPEYGLGMRLIVHG
jgi:opacity protein-like surface antigen